MSEDSKSTPAKTEAVEASETKVSTEKVSASKATKSISQGTKSNAPKRISPKEIISEFEKSQEKQNLPEIYVGDTVKVGVKISEGNKERVQPYEGVIIAKRHGGLNQTITVRRIFQGIGVERVFMVHSPQVASIKVERRGKVRRAKLFYLRDRVGKATRVKQRFDR
nr:50S ribosomal protein L19 [Prochlorococcus sp. MIT 1223]|tara:strand:- start:52 stop:549 length:498 start_codon:yes stop_codon:yes gene_type:complete